MQGDLLPTLQWAFSGLNCCNLHPTRWGCRAEREAAGQRESGLT